MAPMLAVSPHHLTIRWRQCWQFCSMLGNCQHWHHLIIPNKDGANVGSFAASPGHTEQRWRFDSFAALPDYTEQRWRQGFQFRCINWSYNKDGANVPSFAVSQHYLLLQIKAFWRHCWLFSQPHLVIQFKDGVHVFLRDGTGCLRTKNLSNDTLLIDMFKIFFKIHLYLT